MRLRPLQLTDERQGESIRALFEAAGYTDQGILALMGSADVTSIAAKDPAEQLYRTRGDSPLEVLTRLFLISVPVDADAASRAIGTTSLETWIEAGLLDVDENTGQVAGAVNILPFKGLLLAYDTRASLRAGSEEFVMGLGKSSLTLANLTVRRPSGQTLDLGAGGGIQALLAAPHSEKVIATDRNPRAVQFAVFNARLNGITHLEARQGDLFKPVEGEAFDLIVTNPPFVISPERQYIYRDSGLKGDEVCQTIVRDAPRYLNEAGYCVMLCNWAHLKGLDWQERLQDWSKDTGCDTLILRIGDNQC